ncbi:MAG TPA: signal peptidase II [Candidatus Cloacimonas sp.]|nr:signal peptidase II [Candidatus Cloacimonas sp.]MDD2249634.1 signal peptidase II [Candidatus Cloacimonadota bacterium]MCK9158574.1 signal peptidase II [Candidatus Cloacimonas sp.]MCK9164693.1 signal peptidase II [Candidatus Cloacimonas sp.]MDD3734223.1 signal peptidase II [Candidatus Cloacimonadota bacterium]
MKPPLTKLKTAPAYFLMMLIVVMDQLTKTLVRVNMKLYEHIPLLEGLFGDTFLLIKVENPGAAFSIGLGNDLVNRIFFISITVIVVGLIIYLLRRAQHQIQVIAFGLILGGAIGNLIDRVLFGPVTDFFSMDFPDFIMERFPVFNIADSAIFIGVCLLIIDMLFIKDNSSDSVEEDEQLIINESDKEL